jgi:hypothetical protein
MNLDPMDGVRALIPLNIYNCQITWHMQAGLTVVPIAELLTSFDYYAAATFQSFILGTVTADALGIFLLFH